MSRGWEQRDAGRVTDALELAATPWLEPLLPRLGVTAALAARQDQLRLAADDLLAARASFEGDTDPTIAAAVRGAFQRLGRATSAADADAFQRWSRRHFVCPEVPLALFAWRQVLIRATQPAGGVDPLVEPPEEVEDTGPELAALLMGPAVSEAEQEVRRLAPPPSPDDLEIGLDLPAQALSAIEIVRSEAAIAALRELSGRLADGEREAVASWAGRQAEALGVPADRFEWIRYLADEPACEDGPPGFRPDAFT